MIQEEKKDLLLRDLCARLPYGVKVKCPLDDELYTLLSINWNKEIVVIGFMMDEMYVTSKQKLVDIKPYLRPLSSMTEEEKLEFSLVPIYAFVHFNEIAKMDWLNAHHFDYRGLIDRGLAIEVTEENNPYKD
jgi:hypothetical protein